MPSDRSKRDSQAANLGRSNEVSGARSQRSTAKRVKVEDAEPSSGSEVDATDSILTGRANSTAIQSSNDVNFLVRGAAVSPVTERSHEGSSESDQNGDNQNSAATDETSAYVNDEVERTEDEADEQDQTYNPRQTRANKSAALSEQEREERLQQKIVKQDARNRRTERKLERITRVTITTVPKPPNIYVSSTVRRCLGFATMNSCSL